MNNFLFFSLHNLSNQNYFFDLFIIFTAEVFPYLIIIFTFFFLLHHHEIFYKEKPIKAILQKWQEVFFSFIVGILALIITDILKNFFNVLRPFEALPEVNNLFYATGNAFPSGHSTFFMALAFSVYLTHKKQGLILILSALIIGTARVVSGVHYPVDILGGYVLGIILVVFIHYFFKIK